MKWIVIAFSKNVDDCVWGRAVQCEEMKHRGQNGIDDGRKVVEIIHH